MSIDKTASAAKWLFFNLWMAVTFAATNFLAGNDMQNSLLAQDIPLTDAASTEEMIPYSPAEDWQLVYDDGRTESISIADGCVFHIPGGVSPGKMATFTQEIVAPKEQLLQIGVGADWFWRCRLNGRIVADHFTDGNRYSPIQKTNHTVLLPVKPGRNQLEIQVKSGSEGWGLAVGKIPLGYDARKELLKTLLLPSKRPQDNYVQSFLPREFFERLESGAFDGKLYPAASDRAAWETVKTLPEKKPLIREILERADAVLKEEIPSLAFSEYRRFILDGDRAGYEEKYFRRRNNLGVLVLALALTNDKERYLARTIDYLNAILEEWTWCVPAHMSWDSRTRSPEKHYQSDLFASETGAQLALTVNVIGGLLDEDCPGLSGRIRETVLTRAVRNPLSIETCRENLWMHNEIPANWTPWCSANLIVAALILEQNRQRLSEAVRTYLKGVSRFAWYYPEDGYCMEGPTYYSVAAGNLYRLCHVFERVMPGSMENFYRHPKNRAIFEWIAHVVIHSCLVSFGDAGRLGVGEYRNSALLKSCGSTLKSAGLLRLASGPLSLRGCIPGGVGDTLFGGLMALFDIPAEEAAAQTEPENDYSFFRDRLVVFRSSRLSASLKAGNNGEYHNHNDLGHFSVWYEDMPLIIDAGADVYTKQSFSNERYTLWNTRGKGHNAPVFDGLEQLAGKSYFAALSLESGGEKVAVCDLSHSYPEQVGVVEFTRTMRFAPERVSVEDRFHLRQARKARIHLLCAVPPRIDGRRVLFREVALELENLECVSQRNVNASKACSATLPDGSITELVLEATAEQYRMVFSVPEEEGIEELSIR